MTTKENRPRFKTLDEAKSYSEEDGWGICVIHHLLINEDGTFSVMAHINCEWCDHCDEAKALGLNMPDTRYFCSGPHRFKDDPYAGMKAAIDAWDAEERAR